MFCTFSIYKKFFRDGHHSNVPRSGLDLGGKCVHRVGDVLFKSAPIKTQIITHEISQMNTITRLAVKFDFQIDRAEIECGIGLFAARHIHVGYGNDPHSLAWLQHKIMIIYAL